MPRHLRKKHCGLIVPTVSNRVPSRFLFFDTETIQKHKTHNISTQLLRLGVACYWKRETSRNEASTEWFNFTTATEFWDWALSLVWSKRPVYMIAHNIKFDLLVLNVLKEMPQRGWYISQLYEKGTVFLLTIAYPTEKLKTHLKGGGSWADYKGVKWAKKIKCVDNMNLFPGTLKALGHSINSEKRGMPKVNQSDQDWFVYCKQDVQIMVDAWQRKIRFMLDNDLGSLKMTLASQSLETYRHKFMVQEIRRHRHNRVLELERLAYRGGRTEAFYIGQVPDPPVYKLDVNSLYPYVMSVNKYPYEVVGYEKDITLERLRLLVNKYACVALVDIEIDQPVFPVNTAFRNIYPVGYMTLSLTTPEIIYALKRGWIQHIYEVAFYKQEALFKTFVDYFYKMKLEATIVGDSMARMSAKLILNSSYGKWGQLGREDKIIGVCDPGILRVEQGYDIVEKCKCSYTYVGGLVIESYQLGESTYSFPAIAAHVAAYARMYMWSLFLKAGRENVYYTDTDSLFVNTAGYDRVQEVLSEDLLGGLKLEGVGQEVKIHCPKDYEWDGKRTLKGIPKTAVQLDTQSWSIMQWSSFMTHIRKGNDVGYENVTVNKTLERSVNWGVLTPSGKVNPIRFTQGIDNKSSKNMDSSQLVLS